MAHDEVPLIMRRLRLVAWLLAVVGLGLGSVVALAAGQPAFVLVGVAVALGVTQLTGY
jgi:hypothetical protein